ncbi:hypothetical protein RZN05_12185 [Sphingomonas sp. HF-S4]|uniref:Glycosyltransferase RgtA/B/C/D-like domain-containing protein n=1 Tax=Sphingomonas agrestis TaxID=3080540 RepID=A0ABU3Y8M0_9SPHN|nr:hypothetical protein [Sphingomonas sp. HF-S4]MDV3457745.1 hypothetical protein [Sphingomonas sp. HF-S4]
MKPRTPWWETRWFAVAAVLLALVPLALPSVPPFTDLAGHVGRYRVMLGTDSDVLGQWYRYEWRFVGNLGVDLIVAGLGPLIGLEPAVKAAMMLIVALTVTGILWISREAHGRVQPWALLALPLAYNYPLHFGFVNHCLAMALALNGFALWLRLARQGRFRLRAALFVPLATLVWVAHVVGWGALCLMAYGAELARMREQGGKWPASVIRAGLACLPLALPLLFLVLWRSGEGESVTQRFFDFRFKAGWLAMIFRDRWPEFDMASAALLGILLYGGIRSTRTGHARMLTYAGLLLLLAFVLLPFMLFSSAFADMRLAPYIVLLALLALRTGETMPLREKTLLAMIGLAFFGARIAANTASLWDTGRVWEHHLAALDHVPRGARLVSFVGEPCGQGWSHRRTSHLPAFAIARRAAFSNDQWRLGGSTPLRIVAPGVPGYDADPSQMVVSAPCPIQPAFATIHDALAHLPRDRFDYVWLIDPPAFDPRLVAGMTPVWRNETDTLYRIDAHAIAGTRSRP